MRRWRFNPVPLLSSKSKVLRQSIASCCAFSQFDDSISDELLTCLSAAGVREEPAGRAALHVRLAAGVLLAQGARLPLPYGECRSISLSSSDHHHKLNAFSTLKNLLVLAKVKNPLVKALVLSIEFAIYKYYPY